MAFDERGLIREMTFDERGHIREKDIVNDNIYLHSQLLSSDSVPLLSSFLTGMYTGSLCLISIFNHLI
jgi:hypothetical protein